MAKIVVYCRVSTDKQEIEGTSLDTQQSACIAKAHELAEPGDEIVILRETFSGLTLERPELT
ncbi:MAG: recombinase family protein, partial [Gallionella sp.]|nr:recombinase family protein [Gallionella sp.]